MVIDSLKCDSLAYIACGNRRVMWLLALSENLFERTETLVISAKSPAVLVCN